MSNKGQHFLGDVYHFAAVSQNVNKMFSCLQFSLFVMYTLHHLVSMQIFSFKNENGVGV